MTAPPRWQAVGIVGVEVYNGSLPGEERALQPCCQRPDLHPDRSLPGKKIRSEHHVVIIGFARIQRAEKGPPDIVAAVQY